MNPKVNLEYIGNGIDECQVWFDGEYLGSISPWKVLNESEQIEKINDLIDQYSNND